MGSTERPVAREAPTKRRANLETIERNQSLEKDDLELRLEKAVFGDDAGFLDALKTQSTRNANALHRIKSYDDEISGGEDIEEDLGQVPDEDLFFLDPGTGQLPSDISHQLGIPLQIDEPELVNPTWYDSDDDRIRVSLASDNRLRKLRNTEDEDVISGREYIKRLKIQYERLHPIPSWVIDARMQKKKEALHNDEHRAVSDSDVSLDDENVVSSIQPLSELLKTVGRLTIQEGFDNMPRKRRKLRPEVIGIQRLNDVTGPGPSSIDCLQFHDFYPLLLSSGPSSTINLYQISPQPPNPNPLLTSLHVRGTPIKTAGFCNRGALESSTENDLTRILFSSRRRYYHDWSLSTGTVTKISSSMYGETRHEQRTMENFNVSPCSRYIGFVGSVRKGGGAINILSTESSQWICSCRIDSEGGIADFAWWNNGDGMSVVGKNGEVSEFDVASKRVIRRWIDEGAVGTTVIALGGDLNKNGSGESRWVAIGSSSGIVNIYDRRDWKVLIAQDDASLQERPKPARVLDQLTTPVSFLKFSQDGQMLVMASRWKKNALRLVHLPSCTIYRNWPTDKTSLGRISSVAISPEGSHLAVGNEQGKIRLWEIRV